MEYKSIIVRNGRVWDGLSLVPGDVSIIDGKVASLGTVSLSAADMEIDAKGCAVIPGLVDVHVHLREPGYSYKETIADGMRASAHGGFTTVCAMPNLNPAPDTVENIEVERQMISDAWEGTDVLPYATITKGRKGTALVDYPALAPLCVAFSDDGSGVQDGGVMREAMQGIAPTGKILAAHCEVNDLLRGGYIHDGEYARAHGHRGICSESEWREIERNLRLSDITGCPLHVCHISTLESVQLIRDAKKSSVNVTCETGAHYLAFCDMDLQEHGRFKMNPPLRSAADREALLEAAADGTLDMIASDHAPHSEEEKSRGLEKSAMGVTGIELSFPAAYTYLVKRGVVSLKRLLELMAFAPRRRFNIGGGLSIGDPVALSVVDTEASFPVTRDMFLSKGKETPFLGETLYGKVLATIHRDRLTYHA